VTSLRARHVVAVDPIEFKSEKEMDFGATTTFASMEEALPAVKELTRPIHGLALRVVVHG